MTHRSKSTSRHQRREQIRQHKKEDQQVYRITGASESVIADSEHKNKIYAMLIGVRIVSLFVVLLTDGWVQLAVFVGGMLAPWIGVQIANNIRQVQDRSIEAIPPQQAALTAARDDAEENFNDTVIVGDVIGDNTETPSAEPTAQSVDLEEDEKKHDDTRS